ncbi:MAG: ABC transporter permease [Planctomycetes bacterium]|nr:ABC transporter permease [Planctomycetota bacterium]
MNALRRILALVAKEFLAVLRDPKSRFVVIGPPFIQFVVFGYAATFDVTDVRYAVLDESRTAESRRFLADIEHSPDFHLVRMLDSTSQMTDVIESQDVRLVVHVGSDFARRLGTGDPPVVQVVADGRNSNVASVALGYLGRIAARFSPSGADGAGDPSAPRLLVVERSWFNANLSSRWYIVSALAAEIAMVVVMLLTSLSVAREREFGTFDQLLVAPFRAGEILIGKAVPGIVFGIFDGLLLSAAAVWWFGVPFRGAFLAMLAVLFVFVLAIVGVGLLVSSLSTTMQQGLLGSFVFIMPATILSGFTTPVENMPGWLQTLTLANPLRHAVLALRHVFLQGAGPSEVWPQLWPLLVIAGVTLPAASWMFRSRTG